MPEPIEVPYPAFPLMAMVIASPNGVAQLVKHQIFPSPFAFSISLKRQIAYRYFEPVVQQSIRYRIEILSGANANGSNHIIRYGHSAFSAFFYAPLQQLIQIYFRVRGFALPILNHR